MFTCHKIAHARLAYQSRVEYAVASSLDKASKVVARALTLVRIDALGSRSVSNRKTIQTWKILKTSNLSLST